MKSKKKIKIVNKYKFVMSIMLLCLLIITIFSTALGRFSANGSSYNQFVTIEVAAGDTVWAIAQDINSEYLEHDEDVRLIAFAIAQENQLNNYFIYPGQKLIVPIEGY